MNHLKYLLIARTAYFLKPGYPKDRIEVFRNSINFRFLSNCHKRDLPNTFFYFSLNVSFIPKLYAENKFQIRTALGEIHVFK